MVGCSSIDERPVPNLVPNLILGFVDDSVSCFIVRGLEVDMRGSWNRVGESSSPMGGCSAVVVHGRQLQALISVCSYGTEVLYNRVKAYHKCHRPCE